jgi:hypothetical protein
MIQGIEEKRDEVARSIKALSGELATKLTDIASNGVESDYFSASAVLGDQGLALDQLAAAYGLFEDMKCAPAPGPQPQQSGSKVERVWYELSEDMRTWARERKFNDISFSIDVFDEEIRGGDLKAALAALDVILDGLGDRVAREQVRYYTTKMRYLKSLLER